MAKLIFFNTPPQVGAYMLIIPNLLQLTGTQPKAHSILL